MSVEEDALRYAVKNAYEHSGKANAGAVLGKVAALHPDEDVKKLMPKIQLVVDKVNAMSEAELEAEFKRFEEGYELKPQLKEEGLPKLDWATEGTEVVTRSAPNPNGPFHLGNARQYILSSEYSKEYLGRHLLRFDDTDPKVKRPSPEAIEMIKEDLEWLGIEYSEEIYASDRLDVYYQYLKKLVEEGNAYVCKCKSEKWRKDIAEGIGCKCREQDKKKQMELYGQFMEHKLKEGEAVIRIKSDLKNPDPSLRDWWASRIVDKPNHPRTKDQYHVWPSFNLQSAIDDHEFGVTLIIRGQEHSQNTEKQKQLYSFFGWEFPNVFHTGRVKLEGIVLSTSEILKGIEEGKFTGWDDPRLGTIRALKRRGFCAEALKEAVLDIGVRGSDTTIEMSKLIDLNKKYLLKDAEMVTFIENPVQLEVISSRHKEGEIDGRLFQVNEGVEKFLVAGEEMKKMQEGKVFRLKHVYNVRMGEQNELAASATFVGEEKLDIPIIRWLKESVDIEISMPDGKQLYGSANPEVMEIGEGKHVLLDNFGYGIIDEIAGSMVKIRFTHSL